MARFSSSRVMANQRSRGMSFALFIAIRQLVLHGFPTTSTRTSAAAFFSIAWPWPMKILPLIPSRSLRSMPALRGTLPTSSAQFTSRKPSSRSAVGITDFKQRERAIVQFHHHAFERAERGWNLDQMKSERLIGAEHLPGGDAKQERVTDLPGGAGHSDFNGSFHGAISHKRFAEQSQRSISRQSC